MNQFKNILSPIKIGKVEVKNRLMIAPMGDGYGEMGGPFGEYSDTAIEGVATRARGGWGLMFLGCTMFPDNRVDPHHPVYSVLDNPAFFQKKAMLMNDRCKVYDMKLFQQITMGLGRNYDGLVAPSAVPQAIPFGDPNKLTTEITKDQIKEKIDIVVNFAKLCKASGFDGVEIHAMHWGYLLDQFAMAITNHRTDEYGGTLENRLRAAKEIVEGVKQECGSDFPVSMRLGLKSYIKDLNVASLDGEDEAGRTLEEGIRIAQVLEQYGYDALSVDAGVYESFYYACPPSYVPQGHVIDLAAECRKAVNIPVLCGSRMNDPYMIEQALEEGKIDAAVIGRQSLADPFFAKKVEMGKPEKIRPCIGCLVGCIGSQGNGGIVTCAVNPSTRRELLYGIEKAMVPKKVAVIGGGVTGMQAAITAKKRGHDVTIYEKSNELGGLLHAAGAPSFKKEIRQLEQWFRGEVEEMGIPVCYNTELDADKIIELAPDVVIQAMGSGSLMPRSIKGIDHPKAVSFIDAHTSKEKYEDDKKVVIIGGGLVGCETAMDFLEEGKEVTVIEALPELLMNGGIPVQIRMMIPDIFEKGGVDVKTSYKVDEINDIGALVSPTNGGEQIQLEADRVIIAIGRKKAANLRDQLYGTGIEVYSAGDMNGIGNVCSGVASAYEIARMI